MAPSSISLFLKSLLFAPVAITAFLKVFAVVGPFMDGHIATCTESAKSFPRSIPVVDDVINFFRFFCCFSVPFFTTVISVPEGLLLWGAFIALAQPLNVFLGVEASRLAAKWPLTWVSLYTLLFAMFNISIVYPSLWVPAYFLRGYFGRSADAAGSYKISSARAWAVGLSSYLSSFCLLATLFPWTNKSLQFSLVSAMLVLPLIFPILWLAIPVTKSSNQISGHRTVIALQLLSAGFGVAWHLFAICYLGLYPEAATFLLKAFTEPDRAHGTVFFLLVDYIVFCLGVLYQVLLEDGLVVALSMVAGCVFVGPAGVGGLYFAYREEKLLQLAIEAAQKEKRE